MNISKRKKEHLDICLNRDVEDKSYFDDIILVYNALPGLDFKEIDVSTRFLGKKLSLPLIISPLTGGTKEAKKINKSLAEIAEKKKIGFALGSQRAMIENHSLEDTYFVRDVAQSTLIFGNIGFANLDKISVEQIKESLEKVGADALYIHLNPAQEIAQKEGDLNFKHSLEKLENLVKKLNYPIVIKEVGCGISREVGMRLKKIGIKIIDVAGKGGTNWIKVEKLRFDKIDEKFLDFGIPTPCSLLELKDLDIDLISSGGIRSGLDIAKSIALGAKVCGIALPFLKIYKEGGKDGVERYIERLERELKITMFLVGAKNLKELSKVRYILKGFTKNWIEPGGISKFS